MKLAPQDLHLGRVEGGKRERRGGFTDIDGVGDDAFDALDGREPAGVGDVGGLGGPGGNGAGARGDDLDDAVDPGGITVGTVGEQLVEHAALGGGQFADHLDHMDKLGVESAGGQASGGEILQEFGEAERGEGR